MNRELKKAMDAVVESVHNMEADLAQHGMTMDDWLVAQEKRNEELRRKTQEREARKARNREIRAKERAVKKEAGTNEGASE